MEVMSDENLEELEARMKKAPWSASLGRSPHTGNWRKRKLPSLTGEQLVCITILLRVVLFVSCTNTSSPGTSVRPCVVPALSALSSALLRILIQG